MADIEPKYVTPDEFNSKVSAWGSATAVKLKTRIMSLSNKGKGDLVRALRLKTKKDYGEIDRITYTFPRHGVFFHKGVGRGYVMQGSSVVRGSKVNKQTKGYADAKGRSIGAMVISGKNGLFRRPQEWFNPVIEANIPTLADMIAAMRADNAVDATKILIK